MSSIPCFLSFPPDPELSLAPAIAVNRHFPDRSQGSRQLTRAGTEDAAIAALLTQEGFRSPRHGQVLVNTIGAIRRRHRVLQAPSHPRRLPGWLTVSQLAQQLGIPRRWIDQRIRSGSIVVGPHPPMKLHLFPDTEGRGSKSGYA